MAWLMAGKETMLPDRRRASVVYAADKMKAISALGLASAQNSTWACCVFVDFVCVFGV